MKYRHVLAQFAALLMFTVPLMQTVAANDKPATAHTFFPDTFAALATGYVQGVENNRAKDIRITLDGNATSPDILVAYRRESVSGNEDVTGKIEYGYDKNGFLLVTSFRCTPCAAKYSH